AGRYYAMQDASLDDLSHDDRNALANAIDEAWQPRFSADDIALSPLGKVLAIAERLDTLAGGFAAGLKPTGNKDPFALRRNALGLARTIIESGLDIPLDRLIGLATESVVAHISANAESGKKTSGLHEKLPYPWKAAEASAFSEELYDFILDRLRGYYADKGVPTQHFNAVAELRPASLYDFDRRIDAIGTFAQLPEAEALAAANKRINNILKKAGDGVPHAADPAQLQEPA